MQAMGQELYKGTSKSHGLELSDREGGDSASGRGTQTVVKTVIEKFLAEESHGLIYAF
jgi:hypothetical protein